MDAGLIPTFGSLAWTIAAFIVALSVIVAIHEYGHYIVGKWSGIKAEVFSIGFGPVLASRIGKDGTRWQIAALPFGGFVKFMGDTSAASDKPDEEVLNAMTEEERRRTMHGAPLWARAATVAAGPAFNFVLSFLLFAVLLFARGVATDPITVAEMRTVPVEAEALLPEDVLLEINGQNVPSVEEFSAFGSSLEATPTLEYLVRRDGTEMLIEGPWLFPPLASGITPGSAADEGGVREGDVVTAFGGKPIFDFDQLRDAVGNSDGDPVDLTIWRDGETLDVTLQPERRDLPLSDGGFVTRYPIGITGGMIFEAKVEAPGVGEALVYGVEQTIFIVKSSVSGLYHMIAGKISTCNLSGPIGIAEVSGQAASQGWVSFLWFIAVLSTAVGFINLFPIPVLDGGHLVFHAFEWATGRPPSDRALKYLMAGGLTIMLALMIFAVGNDIFCP
ncbi:MAG: RIP metalloprotease RseP [Boseongicola sp.]|nr:RIP metalloprotease RseP [Boseongicola sp.]